MSRDREVFAARGLDDAGRVVAEWTERQSVKDATADLAKIPRKDRKLEVVDEAGHLLAVGTDGSGGHLLLYTAFVDPPAPAWVVDGDGFQGQVADAHGLGFHVVPLNESSVVLTCSRCRAERVVTLPEVLGRSGRVVVH